MGRNVAQRNFGNTPYERWGLVSEPSKGTALSGIAPEQSQINVAWRKSHEALQVAPAWTASPCLSAPVTGTVTLYRG